MINRQALETIASWMANLVGARFLERRRRVSAPAPRPPTVQQAADFTAHSFHLVGARLVDLLDPSSGLQLPWGNTLSFGSSKRILTNVSSFGAGFNSTSTTACFNSISTTNACPLLRGSLPS